MRMAADCYPTALLRRCHLLSRRIRRSSVAETRQFQCSRIFAAATASRTARVSGARRANVSVGGSSTALNRDDRLLHGVAARTLDQSLAARGH